MSFSKRIKAVFWDNDGVLALTEKIYFEACRISLSSYGIVFSADDFIEYSLKRGVNVLNIAGEKVSSDDLREFSKRVCAVYSELLQAKGTEVINSGAVEVVDYLYGKVKMGIVTSSRKIHFDLIHKESPIIGKMDFILTHEDYRATKPDPDPYLKALEASGLAPEECVVIEDSARGIEAARAAGIDVIGITSEFFNEQDLCNASAVIDDVTDLKKILFPL